MLTKAQLITLSEELKDKRFANLLMDQDYPAIAALLNDRPMVDNPVAQPEVPRTFTWSTFISLLTVAERLGLYSDYGNLAGDLRNALERNDAEERNALWAAVKSKLLPTTVTKVETAFAESQPDESWAAVVPGDSRATALGLPRVEPKDVQAVDSV